ARAAPDLPPTEAAVALHGPACGHVPAGGRAQGNQRWCCLLRPEISHLPPATAELSAG
ncbi:unnamed protein product, partial [Effrenium voratum]